MSEHWSEKMSPEALGNASRLVEIAHGELVARSPLGFRDRLADLWDKGLPRGERTGWPSIDKHYTVAPGQLTIVTGWPSSGKSEWLDALLLNLARSGWRFALFSPENEPGELHVSKFLEKFAGKPFGDGLTERMTKDEMIEAATEIEDWFSFIGPKLTTEKTVFQLEEVLHEAETSLRLRKFWHSSEHSNGLVIDPWNELEHLRPREWSETEYVSATLSMLRSWARRNRIHVWLVAHPQKLKREDGKLPVPRPDAISGSMHWWNKADNCITVWREPDPDSPAYERQDVHIYVQKIRFKHIGYPGEVVLRYDRVTGRYFEAAQGLREVAR